MYLGDIVQRFWSLLTSFGDCHGFVYLFHLFVWVTVLAEGFPARRSTGVTGVNHQLLGFIGMIVRDFFDALLKAVVFCLVVVCFPCWSSVCLAITLLNDRGSALSE